MSPTRRRSSSRSTKSSTSLASSSTAMRVSLGSALMTISLYIPHPDPPSEGRSQIKWPHFGPLEARAGGSLRSCRPPRMQSDRPALPGRELDSAVVGISDDGSGWLSTFPRMRNRVSGQPLAEPLRNGFGYPMRIWMQFLGESRAPLPGLPGTVASVRPRASIKPRHQH